MSSSIITENTSSLLLESSALILETPSLVYPSLPKRCIHHNDDDKEPKQDKKNLQSSIHFASRLIKLRSELRSPSSFIRTRSQSYQQDYFSSRLPPPPPQLSEVGRVHSLPNVLHPYSNILDREDESEIATHLSFQEEEASQLTYVSQLVCNNNKHFFHHAKSNHLNLPPITRRMTTNDTTPKKSVSLRAIMVDEVMRRDKRYSSSLALATQLLYASSQKKKEEGHHDEKEANFKEEEEDDIQSFVTAQEDMIQPSNCYFAYNKKKSMVVPPALYHDFVKPKPSLSCDTIISSDSEDDETSQLQVTTTAVLVSLSPSSAAAATVARSRRSNTFLLQQTRRSCQQQRIF